MFANDDRKLLTVGMATNREPEDVWFVLTALHANHPRVSYLVVDNSPARCRRTEAIVKAVGGTYLHRPDYHGTARPRAAIFERAETPWVCCIDSHVIFESGSIDALLQFARRNTDFHGMVQGRMVWDNGVSYSDAWNQPASPGLWGEWVTLFGKSDDEPYEIPMLGLGMFAMPKKSWPGFNRLFRGFGGEEGYLHEKMRRSGGKVLCHPEIHWRHKFRDESKPSPYPARREDHIWNLLVGHRELGIDAVEQIRTHFAKDVQARSFNALVKRAAQSQPAGVEPPKPKPKRILALWYSDNSAPDSLLTRSLRSVIDAADEANGFSGHTVTVSACSWGGFGRSESWDYFVSRGCEPQKYRGRDGVYTRGYQSILEQMKQAADAVGGWDSFDAVCLCEHDVIYPPNYFVRMADGFSAHGKDWDVVANLDYIGLNETGWQWVKERHMPLHQIGMSRDKFVANWNRAYSECQSTSGGAVVLEPDHGSDRREWLLLPVDLSVQMPSIHVNHEGVPGKGRLSSHGEVCYWKSGWSLYHPFWGSADKFWPHGETKMADRPGMSPEQYAKEQSDCPSCRNPAEEAAQPDNLRTMSDLLRNCSTVAEVSYWGSQAESVLVDSLKDSAGSARSLVSYSPTVRNYWTLRNRELGKRFTPVVCDLSSDPNRFGGADFLFVDAFREREELRSFLGRVSPSVSKYIAVVIPEGSAAVLEGVRDFLAVCQEWTVIHYYQSASGGMIFLSILPEDRKRPPHLLTMAWNYAKAKLVHMSAGKPVVSEEEYKRRLELCLVCEYRNIDSCSACGCPLSGKLEMQTEVCGLQKLGLPPRW